MTKNTTWEERDKAIKEGEEALNNANVKKYSADPQARFGCKGKSKFWFGYKGHVGIDMGSGLIESAALNRALGCSMPKFGIFAQKLQNLNSKPLFLTLF